MAKDFIMRLRDSAVRAKLSSVGLYVNRVRKPEREGEVICDEYWFSNNRDASLGDVIGVLSLWRPGSGHESHGIILWGQCGDLARESSTSEDWLINFAAFCLKHVVPKVQNCSRKRAKLEISRLVQGYLQRNPRPTAQVAEGLAKDFIRGLARGIKIRRSGGQQYWSYENGTLTVIGQQIVAYRGNQSEQYHMVKYLVQHLKAERKTQLAVLDHWEHDRESTVAMHKAISRLMEEGELLEGPSRGHWNFYPIPAIAEGKARSFITGTLGSMSIDEFLTAKGFIQAAYLPDYYAKYGNGSRPEGPHHAGDYKVSVVLYRPEQKACVVISRWNEEQQDWFAPELQVKFISFDQLKSKINNLTESSDQLSLFNADATYSPGTVKKFLASLGGKYRSGTLIDNGARFRKLAGHHRNDGVYIWTSKSRNNNWTLGTIVIVLLVSQGFGRADREWPIMQIWQSFDLLKNSLRTWRNLRGSKLFINGVPSGKVEYRNPELY
jgi:hypothetical protein